MERAVRLLRLGFVNGVDTVFEGGGHEVSREVVLHGLRFGLRLGLVDHDDGGLYLADLRGDLDHVGHGLSFDDAGVGLDVVLEGLGEELVLDELAGDHALVDVGELVEGVVEALGVLGDGRGGAGVGGLVGGRLVARVVFGDDLVVVVGGRPTHDKAHRRLGAAPEDLVQLHLTSNVL